MHNAHVYNVTAKILRQEFPQDSNFGFVNTGFSKVRLNLHRAVVANIALAFAKRFSQDSLFDPIKFLDQCSPNPDRYPFSELWEE